MLAVEELLPVLGSALLAETVAVLFSVPVGAVTCTVICMTAPFRDQNAKGIIVPALQLTMPPANAHGTGVFEQVNLLLTVEQAKLVPDALKKAVPGGRESFTLTFTALAGPKSPTAMRYVSLVPERTFRGATFKIATSAGPTTV